VSSFLISVTAVPATEALATVASGVTDGGINNGGFPITAITVLTLLGLGALTLAGIPSASTYRRRPIRRRPSQRPGISKPEPATKAHRAEPAISTTDARALVEAAAATFAPISLPAVERRAGLASRSERKYIFDMGTFESLISALGTHYEILEIGDQRVFAYDSIYFDSPELIVYRHHVQGRRKRFKSRTRLYSESGPCYFELKCKGVRGRTVKRRFELPVEEHGLLTDEGLAFLHRELESYGAPLPPSLRPGLRTHYRRLTLVNRMDTERLTFDFELAFSLQKDRHAIRPGRILLETKKGTGTAGTNGTHGNGYGSRRAPRAPDAGKVLVGLGVRPVQSCSKYCIGIALTHPDIHDNRFRRLIRNHFDPTSRARADAVPDALVPQAEFEIEEGDVIVRRPGLLEGPAGT
jgi:hypothetical protein